MEQDRRLVCRTLAGLVIYVYVKENMRMHSLGIIIKGQPAHPGEAGKVVVKRRPCVHVCVCVCVCVRGRVGAGKWWML